MEDGILTLTVDKPDDGQEMAPPEKVAPVCAILNQTLPLGFQPLTEPGALAIYQSKGPGWLMPLGTLNVAVLPAATVRVPVVLAIAPKLHAISDDAIFVTGPLE